MGQLIREDLGNKHPFPSVPVLGPKPTRSQKVKDLRAAAFRGSRAELKEGGWNCGGRWIGGGEI